MTHTYSQISDLYPATSMTRTLELAAADGWQIDKAADPVDDAAADISVELAAEVAASDPGLLTFTR